MSVAKNIEISATSTESFEDAIRQGVKRASNTVDNVCGVWIKEQKADVKNGEITDFRVDMTVTFILSE